jgi:hypothetical protein
MKGKLHWNPQVDEYHLYINTHDLRHTSKVIRTRGGYDHH